MNKSQSITSNLTISSMEDTESEDIGMPINFIAMKPLKWAIPLLGYGGTALIIITFFTNIFIVIVLVQRHMRSPTNTLLACMAITDMLTGLFPLPWMIHFYIKGAYKNPVGLHWCRYYSVGVMHIPTIFHTASIWLITTLAIQRYMYVCYPNTAKKWCTIPKVLIFVGIIYILSFTYNFARFFEHIYSMRRLSWKQQMTRWGFAHLLNVKTTNTKPIERYHNLNFGENQKLKNSLDITTLHCAYTTAKWLRDWENVFYNVYYWFRVIFVHVIPCIILVVLNGLLIHAMKKAIERRKQILFKNYKKHIRVNEEISEKKRDTYSTTYMLVLVVSVFLIVEIPLGIIFILHIIQNTFLIQVLNYEIAVIFSTLIDFSILASYPINFFIYCRMSRQFRQTFNHLMSRLFQFCRNFGSENLSRSFNGSYLINDTTNTLEFTQQPLIRAKGKTCVLTKDTSFITNNS